MKHIFLILALTFTFAGNAFGECSESDKKALEALDHAGGEAATKGDRNALMAMLADDYTSLPSMQNKTQSIEATMATFERDKANPGMANKVTYDNYMITCTPNSAVIMHRNILTTKSGAGGKEQTVWSRTVHVLEKRGGKWQMVTDAGNRLDEYATLRYMEMDWNTADVNRDLSWFEQNYAADYSGISSRTAKINTKAEELAGFKDDKNRTESAELSEMNIRIDGNTAVVTGVNHVKGRDEKISRSTTVSALPIRSSSAMDAGWSGRRKGHAFRK